MDVRLISVTKPINDIKDMSAEEMIVYIARVSNPSNQFNSDTSDKLISYLIRHRHWSPFEMADMTVEIVTSRAIAQQIVRHRSFSFQEFSQRYAQVYDIEPIQLRHKAEKNRQSSASELSGDSKSYFAEKVNALVEAAKSLYGEMLDSGIAKECARFILPMATQTKIYMKGSVRSWIHYLEIREDEHTQLEHREIANRIREIFKDQFPNISKALQETE